MSRWILLFVLAVAIVAAVAVFAAFRHDLAAARARVEGRSALAQTGFGPLEYAAVGAGEPVLAIHGAAGGFDQGLDMTGALAERGFRLIAPSRFGYLRSARPNGLSTEMQADAYAQLLDRMGVDRVTVVAISAGAWSAIQFGARHPDRCRGLVLLVPADHLPEGTAIRGGPLADAVFRSDFVAWAALKATPVAPGLMGRTMLGVDGDVLRRAAPAEQQRVGEVLAHLLPIGPRKAGMRFDIETAAVRRPYPLPGIRCPVLAISAEDDAFGTAARARQIAATVPNGRALIFPTGGHALVGRYDAALQAVTAFARATPP